VREGFLVFDPDYSTVYERKRLDWMASTNNSRIGTYFDSNKCAVRFKLLLLLTPKTVEQRRKHVPAQVYGITMGVLSAAAAATSLNQQVLPNVAR